MHSYRQQQQHQMQLAAVGPLGSSITRVQLYPAHPATPAAAPAAHAARTAFAAAESEASGLCPQQHCTWAGHDGSCQGLCKGKGPLHQF